MEAQARTLCGGGGWIASGRATFPHALAAGCRCVPLLRPVRSAAASPSPAASASPSPAGGPKPSSCPRPLPLPLAPSPLSPGCVARPFWFVTGRICSLWRWLYCGHCIPSSCGGQREAQVERAECADAGSRPEGSPLSGQAVCPPAPSCCVASSLPPPAGGSIGDFVWQDLDGDGVQDPNEPGLPGVTVVLLSCNGTMVRSTTTDANGQYAFSGLPAGSYRVVFVAPSGSTAYSVSPAGQGGDAAKDSDMDASGTTACISLSPGESRTDIDAGFIPGVCVAERAGVCIGVAGFCVCVFGFGSAGAGWGRSWLGLQGVGWLTFPGGWETRHLGGSGWRKRRGTPRISCLLRAGVVRRIVCPLRSAVASPSPAVSYPSPASPASPSPAGGCPSPLSALQVPQPCVCFTVCLGTGGGRAWQQASQRAPARSTRPQRPLPSTNVAWWLAEWQAPVGWRVGGLVVVGVAWTPLRMPPPPCPARPSALHVASAPQAPASATSCGKTWMGTACRTPTSRAYRA